MASGLGPLRSNARASASATRSACATGFSSAAVAVACARIPTASELSQGSSVTPSRPVPANAVACIANASVPAVPVSSALVPQGLARSIQKLAWPGSTRRTASGPPASLGLARPNSVGNASAPTAPDSSPP
jgi:hypothetical protein